MQIAISKPPIFTTKRYGRFINFADRIERSSEDYQECNRPVPDAEEEIKE